MRRSSPGHSRSKLKRDADVVAPSTWVGLELWITIDWNTRSNRRKDHKGYIRCMSWLGLSRSVLCELRRRGAHALDAATCCGKCMLDVTLPNPSIRRSLSTLPLSLNLRYSPPVHMFSVLPFRVALQVYAKAELVRIAVGSLYAADIGDPIGDDEPASEAFLDTPFGSRDAARIQSHFARRRGFRYSVSAPTALCRASAVNSRGAWQGAC